MFSDRNVVPGSSEYVGPGSCLGEIMATLVLYGPKCFKVGSGNNFPHSVNGFLYNNVSVL